PRAEQRAGKTERRELQEEIVLGDAELDVLALRRHRPSLGGDDLLFAESIAALGAVEDAAAIDPGAKVRRNGNVGRGRHDARGKLPLAGGKAAEDAAESFLRG